MNDYERFMANLYCPDRERELHVQLAGLAGTDEVKRPWRLLLWLSRLAARRQKPAAKAQKQGAIVPQDGALRKAG